MFEVKHLTSLPIWLKMGSTGKPQANAFTLVEVLIVVIVIGIVAAIAVPYYTHASDQSRINALSAMVRTVQEKVTERKLRTGTAPVAIDPVWFNQSQLPQHPQNTLGLPSVETVSTAGLFHPANKVLAAGVGGAFWYNATEGVFRARVAGMSSSAATIAIYNFVNGCSETALGNFTGGSSGSSGSSGGTGGTSSGGTSATGTSSSGTGSSGTGSGGTGSGGTGSGGSSGGSTGGWGS